MMGGAEKQIVTLAPAFLSAGFDVHILSILPTLARQDEVERLGIPIIHLRLVKGMRGISAVAGAARVLRRLRPDVVASFVYQANVLARVAGRIAGVPVIVSSIRNEQFGPRWRERALRATDSLCTVTTTNSERVARSLVARGIVPAGRLQVVPNGIDTAQYEVGPSARDETRQALGLSASSFLWLLIGRLDAQKDVPNLLHAFRSHRSRHPGSRLCIVGDGPLRAPLEASAVELGVAAMTTFLGIRTDVPQLLAAADALVLSSAWEGLPNVVMEAMAASRPVVATDVGGVAELVEEGVTGFRVAPGDPAALATAMDRLVACEPAERATMGARARAVVGERFSLQSAAEQWVALLRDGIAGGAVAAGRDGLGP